MSKAILLRIVATPIKAPRIANIKPSHPSALSANTKMMMVNVAVEMIGTILILGFFLYKNIVVKNKIVLSITMRNMR